MVALRVSTNRRRNALLPDGACATLQLALLLRPYVSLLLATPQEWQDDTEEHETTTLLNVEGKSIERQSCFSDILQLNHSNYERIVRY
jgi:hypothetical protein